MTAPVAFHFEEIGTRRMRARCTACPVFPRPGLMVECRTRQGDLFYAHILAVHPDPADTDVLHMDLEPVSGEPDTRLASFRFLLPQQLLQLRQPDPAEARMPWTVQDVTLDLARSGNRILVSPVSPDGVAGLVGAYSSSGHAPVIIDPVGLSLPQSELSRLRLGPDVRLSLQDVGLNTFSDWVAAALPPAVRSQAIELLLSLVPPTPDFIPLHYFVSHPSLNRHALGAAILHQLYAYHQAGLFASSPAKLLTAQPVEAGSHLDLSSLPAVLQPNAYQGLINTLLKHETFSQKPWVFVSPEVCTDDDPLKSACFNRNQLFVVTNHPDPWDSWATDRLITETRADESLIHVSGQIVDHLALTLTDRTVDNTLFQVQTQAPVATPAALPADARPAEPAQAFEPAAGTDWDNPTTEADPDLPDLSFLTQAEQPSVEAQEAPAELPLWEPPPLLSLENLNAETPEPPAETFELDLDGLFGDLSLETEAEAAFLTDEIETAENDSLFPSSAAETTLLPHPEVLQSESEDLLPGPPAGLFDAGTSDETDDPTLFPVPDVEALPEESGQEGWLQDLFSADETGMTGFLEADENPLDAPVPVREAAADDDTDMEDALAAILGQNTLEAPEEDVLPDAFPPSEPTIPSTEPFSLSPEPEHPTETDPETHHVPVLDGSSLTDFSEPDFLTQLPEVAPSIQELSLQEWPEEEVSLSLEPTPALMNADASPPDYGTLSLGLEPSETEDEDEMSLEVGGLPLGPEFDSSWFDLSADTGQQTGGAQDPGLPVLSDLTGGPAAKDTIGFSAGSDASPAADLTTASDLNFDFDFSLGASEGDSAEPVFPAPHSQPEFGAETSGNFPDLSDLFGESTPPDNHLDPLSLNLDFHEAQPVSEETYPPLSGSLAEWPSADMPGPAMPSPAAAHADTPAITTPEPHPNEFTIPILSRQGEDDASSPPEPAFEAGEQVRHERYGEGVIQRVIPMENNQIILNIRFDRVGKRLLDPQLTRLEKVEAFRFN